MQKEHGRPPNDFAEEFEPRNSSAYLEERGAGGPHLNLDFPSKNGKITTQRVI